VYSKETMFDLVTLTRPPSDTMRDPIEDFEK
jgi:hypothetical protein